MMAHHNADAQPYNHSHRRSADMSHKLVDLDNSVYALLDQYEAAGVLGFLPLARPYSKGSIIGYLKQLLANTRLSRNERYMINYYYEDLLQSVNGFTAWESETKNTYTALGAGASVEARTGLGGAGTFATSNIMKPFLAGDLGSNISYFAAMEFSIDRMAGDMFHESYVKDGAVHMPCREGGYAWHPYQFKYTTTWAYINITDSHNDGPVLNNLTAGVTYQNEISGAWFDDALRLSLHNNRRSWGYNHSNLILAAQARPFTGIDLVISPVKKVTYSMLVGSLFSHQHDQNNYKAHIYGYDLGTVEKMYTLQMLEYTPFPFMQIMLSTGNIWKKRMEMTYIMPFTIPYLTQADNGEYDNMSMSMGLSLLLPTLGKVWIHAFIDEFNYTGRRNLVTIPQNLFAWQCGWRSGMFSHFSWIMSLTRVAPFVYTHAPEDSFNTLSSRPYDMTYTHDGSNLGIYLPPNSGEAKLVLTTLAIPSTALSLDCRYILHGTNDLALAGDSLLLTGDVYRYHDGYAKDYPHMNLGHDGIYDHTVYAQLRAEHRIRHDNENRYFRLYGSVAASRTWWKANDSGVTAPDAVGLVTVSAGFLVDI